MNHKRVAATVTLSAIAAVIAISGLAAPPPAPYSNTTFETAVQPLLEKNCYLCHNENLKSGGLNLQAYTSKESVLADRDRWDKILHRLDAGEMPPKGMPGPWLTSTISADGAVKTAGSLLPSATAPAAQLAASSAQTAWRAYSEASDKTI